MCLAIYKPAATKPDEEAYRNGFNSNEHGAGFAAVANGCLVVSKGFFKFDEFWEAFQPYADADALIHFRYATHGKRDADNCHPFLVADNLAMIHNGILPICTKDNEDKSDTWHFVEKVLKPLYGLDTEFYRHDAISYLGSLAIDGSKFAFLRSDGDFAIWNDNAGVWEDDGHWYSNSAYKTKVIRYSGYSSYKYDDDYLGGYRSSSYGGRGTPERDDRNPRASSETESFPDYDPEVLPLGAWGPDVPVDMEWIADELLRFGYLQADIERGFADDASEMHNLLMEHYDELDEKKEAEIYGLNFEFNGEQ
jgi:predicted glutamine amidotransferase